MFTKVLVANRGEIAVRVIRACKALNIQSVAVYAPNDFGAFHTVLADEAIEIESYLDGAQIIEASKRVGAQAIHPGYGFLSENADFAALCQNAGVAFVGPPASAISAMGDKVTSRNTMQEAGVPVVPGTPILASVEKAIEAADKLGYPVLLKATAGGGGIGMQLASSEAELRTKFDSAKSTAQRAFGNDAIYLEKYVENPRHIEIQVLADAQGNTVYLGERECSIQRRHQKILEETPSTAIDDNTRERMGAAAVAAARAVGYVSAGTVEFIFGGGEFFFLEMNTRLQVEHPVTEMVYGVDLVAEQLRIAFGEALGMEQTSVKRNGHAIECRINAENYAKKFFPSPGTLTGYHEPSGPGVRVDSSISGPAVISPSYDPMIAKLIVWGETRDGAIQRMRRALFEYVIVGIATNIPYHLALLESPDFQAGALNTHFIEDHPDLIARADWWAAEQSKLLPLVDDQVALEQAVDVAFS